MRSHIVVVGIVAICLTWSASAASGSPMLTAVTGDSLNPNTRFYAPPLNQGALDQITELKADGRRSTAKRLRRMIDTPQAVWFTGGTPRQVRRYVRDTVAVPTL